VDDPSSRQPALSLLTTAIHAGHDVHPAAGELMALDDATRLREEDPHTDRLADLGGPTVAVRRSRFEIDLNRARDEAIYRTPDMAWGLDVWRAPLPVEVIERSLAFYDRFYAQMAATLDEQADRGPFVVLDVHSYNHRRDGADRPPAPAVDNPVVNVGTGTLDHERWRSMTDAFMATLAEQVAGGEQLDVRENVRFQGGHLSRWINERYEGRGCALAIELKKVFMDEWTGEVDEAHLRELNHALAAAAGAVVRPPVAS
jgi:N-formylglutamate amidohydrolase